MDRKNVFWGMQSEKTHLTCPQPKGFALKHHQHDSKQLFAKVKILHFFQNFDFGKCWFYLSFSAGNESWKSWNINFSKKCRFNDGEMIFGQTLLVLDQFGCVLSISELRNAFGSILRHIFWSQSRKVHFFLLKMPFCSDLRKPGNP